MRIGALDQADPQARGEARRHQRVATAHRSGWPEIPRKHLRFDPFSIVVDERDGTTFTVYRGEVVDAIGPAYPVSAYYIDEQGDAVFLEKRATR